MSTEQVSSVNGNWEFFFEDLNTGQYTPIYDNFTCSPGTGAAWFSYEVWNWATYGWPNFQSFPVSYADAESDQYNNYINYFNYIVDDMFNNRVYPQLEVASPGPVGSYGNFTMCNC